MTEQTLLEEVDQFKDVGSTQTKEETSVKEVKIRLKLAHSATTMLAILWKNKAISFPQRVYSIGHLTCQCFSMGVRAGW